MLERSIRVLSLAGATEEYAQSVAESLVQAQESGHTSHGVMRLIEYVGFTKKGEVIPDAKPEVTSDRGAVIRIDGKWGWGQIACKLAVDLVAEKALNFGIGAVAIDSCNHIGRLGEYVELLAKKSLVSIMLCNTGPCVAAHGGKSRLFGTNPFAAGIPSSDGDIVIDFATAGTAEGKLRVARSHGREVPLGLVITKDGKPTQDPGEFYQGGALLPFGGHKGYCLNLLVDLLGGALSGIHPAMNEGYDHGNGTLVIAMNPDFFVGLNNFASDISEAKRHIKNAPAIEVKSPVLLPGEMEEIARLRNRDSIEIPQNIWSEILHLEMNLANGEQSHD